MSKLTQSQSGSGSDSAGRPSVKTLAIRLEPGLHAQLSMIALLRGSTITEEIRTAVVTHVGLARANPELTARATEALEDIERQADIQRAAITTLLGNTEPGGRATEPDGSAASTPPGEPPAPVGTADASAPKAARRRVSNSGTSKGGVPRVK